VSRTRDNSGSIAKNDRKEQPNHPDIKGKATVGGVEYWVSGWLKENDRGKWYSLSFTPIVLIGGRSGDDDAPAEPARGGGTKPGKAPAALDDDIPFEKAWR
jgi:hypothetical protein